MSALVMGKVFYLDVDPILKLTLLSLADHAHDDGTSVYPTKPRLVIKTGLSRATVFRHISEALDGGIIEKVGRRGGGPVEYRFDMTILDAAEQARRPSQTSQSETSTTKRSQRETSQSETSTTKRSQSETLEVSQLDVRRLTGETLN